MEKFDHQGFVAALDAERSQREMTWKAVASEAKVSASTLTRIAQGRRPDIDTLTALCSWSGLVADDYMRTREDRQNNSADHLSEFVGHLRADKKLTPEGARAIESLLKVTYEQFRKK